MTGRGMSRRTFVASVGGIAARTFGVATMVRRWSPWRLLVAVDPLPPTVRLVTVFRQPASAAAVGEWYRVLAPDESAERLAAAVLAALPGGVRGLAGSDGQLRAALAARVQDEYAAGDVVELDGWIVAITEARLCALCAAAGGTD